MDSAVGVQRRVGIVTQDAATCTAVVNDRAALQWRHQVDKTIRVCARRALLTPMLNDSDSAVIIAVQCRLLYSVVASCHRSELTSKTVDGFGRRPRA